MSDVKNAQDARVEEISRIAGIVKNAIKVDGRSGEMTSEPEVYKTALPEDLTIKTVKQVHDHDRNFIAGTTKAVGEIALEALVAHKNLDEVSGSVPMLGRDNIEYAVPRTREVSGGLGEDKQPLPRKTQYAPIQVSVHVHGQRAGAGDLSKIRADHLEAALTKLGKK